MRQSLGTAVFAGMLGVTLFGLVFTPVFYVLTRNMGFWRRLRLRFRRPETAAPSPTPATPDAL